MGESKANRVTNFSKHLVFSVFVFIAMVHLAYTDENRTRVPCGTGFLRACDNNPQAVIPKIQGDVRKLMMTWGSCIYNKCKDIHGQAVNFPTGMSVNLATGEAEPYGSPVCAICKNRFNRFTEEYSRNNYNESCGPTPLHVTMTPRKILVDPGKITESYFYGSILVVLEKKLNEALADIKKTQTIVFSDGCKSFGLKMDRFTNEKNGVLKDLTKLMGESGMKQIVETEGEFERFLTKHAPPNQSQNESNEGLNLVNREVANKDPMEAKLKQLVYQLMGITLNIEAAAVYLVACTVFEKTGIEFRQHFTTWSEFFNNQIVNRVTKRVARKVAMECGFCRQMNTCLSCADRVANHYAPTEVEAIFREKLAPYCENFSSDPYATGEISNSSKKIEVSILGKGLKYQSWKKD